MAEERRPNDAIDKQVDNPVENSVTDSKQTDTQKADAPNATIKQPEVSPHKIAKPEKQPPQWWQAIKGFFYALFVTPWALMQKVFLRIAGGKKLVEEAENQMLAEQQENKVREAQDKNAKFMEREINDILQTRIQDPAYLAEGLSITKVQFRPDVTGDGNILHSITVTCQNGTEYGGEYQIHLGTDGLLRCNAIVPEELQLQLSELIRSATITVHKSEVGDHDEPNEPDEISNDFIDEPTPIDPKMLVHAHTIQNSHNGFDITVTRSLDKATIEITDSKGENVVLRDANGNDIPITVALINGNIRIDNLPQHIASNPAIAQSVFQAYHPYIQHQLQEAVAQGHTVETMQGSALQNAFLTMRESVFHNLNTPVTDLTRSTSMFILPNGDGMATIINENISPDNKKGDMVHLNAYRLNVTNPTQFEFEQTQAYTKDPKSGTYIPSKIQIDNGEQAPKFTTDVTHQAFYVSQKEQSWNEHLAQFYFAATNLSIMPVKMNAQQEVEQQFVVFGDRAAISQSSNLRLATCANVITRGDGFELQTESSLNDEQLQTITTMIHRDDAPTTFSTETCASAVEALTNAAKFHADNEKFTRYFIMGDVAMSYNGQAISMQRPGDTKPFLYNADKLDPNVIESAYGAYSAHAAERDEYDNNAPNNDEESLGD